MSPKSHPGTEHANQLPVQTNLSKVYISQLLPHEKYQFLPKSWGGHPYVNIAHIRDIQLRREFDL